MIHDRYFNTLEKIAIAIEPVGAARIAACLVYKGSIISFGFNKRKTHPLQRKYSKNEDSIYLHAEIDCIKNALKNNADIIEKCTLYILRMKKDENNHSVFIRGLAKPCSGCSHAIDQFNIKKVYYTTDNNTVESL